MTIRLSKIALVFIIGINLTIVAFNNLMDYSSNYNFVKNVMEMDSTFPDNSLKWRAITSPFVWNATYIVIILWEFSIAFFCWLGIIKMFKHLRSDTGSFESSKMPAITGLTLCLLLFGFAFISVAGEWFLMWQSDIWNGESAALKLFLMSGISLIYLNMKD